MVVCTNPDSVNPGESTTFALVVDVAPQASPGVTTLATVYNATDRNSSNNTTGDPTVVLAK
jgi:hypothetical protein